MKFFLTKCSFLTKLRLTSLKNKPMGKNMNASEKIKFRYTVKFLSYRFTFLVDRSCTLCGSSLQICPIFNAARTIDFSIPTFRLILIVIIMNHTSVFNICQSLTEMVKIILIFFHIIMHKFNLVFFKSLTPTKQTESKPTPI